MRPLRLLTVVGLSIGACALAAPAANACILDSVGAMSVSGGTVRQGDLVRITMQAIGTDESPGASPYVITANNAPIDYGMATPDANHVWTGDVTVPLNLGAYEGPVRIVVTLTDSNQPLTVPYTLAYDGTPSAGPQPAPATTGAPASQQPGVQPGSPPATTRAAPRRPAPRIDPPRAAKVHRPAKQRPARTGAATPRLHGSAPAQVRTATSVAQTTQITPRVAPRSPRAQGHRAKRARRAVAPRVARATPVMSAPAPRVALPVARARAAQPEPVAAYLGTALIALLLIGGAGLAGVAVRRRAAPLEPPDPHAAEIEAELQELIFEERLRGGAEEPRTRTPV